ncbi:MAG: hypothetical protein ACRERZ_04930, partial [Gammaproteobacteria bacterium]
MMFVLGVMLLFMSMWLTVCVPFLIRMIRPSRSRFSGMTFIFIHRPVTLRRMVGVRAFRAIHAHHAGTFEFPRLCRGGNFRPAMIRRETLRRVVHGQAFLVNLRLRQRD